MSSSYSHRRSHNFQITWMASTEACSLENPADARCARPHGGRGRSRATVTLPSSWCGSSAGCTDNITRRGGGAEQDHSLSKATLSTIVDIVTPEISTEPDSVQTVYKSSFGWYGCKYHLRFIPTPTPCVRMHTPEYIKRTPVFSPQAKQELLCSRRVCHT